MPMDTSLAPFKQVLRKLCLFKPLQSREPLPGRLCSIVLSRDKIPLKMPYLQLTPQIEVFLSVLELGRHKLLITYGFTIMTPSLCGWEAFKTPGALTHIRITWSLSPMAPQVPNITPGSPLCPRCCGHSSQRGAQQLGTKFMAEGIPLNQSH
jgi:hypothetical protein